MYLDMMMDYADRHDALASLALLIAPPSWPMNPGLGTALQGRPRGARPSMEAVKPVKVLPQKADIAETMTQPKIIL